jgi:hypothetical protein
VLAGLSLGCGRLVEVVVGERLSGPLVLPVGLTVVILAGELATLTDATAELAGPLVVALAVVGLLLGRPWQPREWEWPAAVGVGVFAVFAAPVVLSGKATFAGYIKLDDTATYFAMTDRVMEHARSLTGLAPSTYEATLATTLAIGYPTGSLMPLGLGHQLLSYDIAWLFQPYLAFLAAMLGLSLYAVLERVIEPRGLRAAAAFLAAQPALLFGYGLWGGIKELSGAWLLALMAALLPWTLGERRSWRAVLPLAASCASVVCVLSLPGAVWLLPIVVAGAVVLIRRPRRPSLATGIAFACALGVLAIPAFVAAVDWLPHVHAFSEESELGNLIRRLSPFQLFGIWPVGDFRVHPHASGPTYVLIALVIAAGAVGIWWAWTRRSWALLTYVLTAGVGCLLIVVFSSPWVGGKALAMASPAFLAAALAGCGAGFARKRTVEASVAVLAIAGGVLWSNALQYHHVWLAPRGQLHELELIGNRFAGQGPALMTNYEPYGARHFLRREDAEGASELRRRFDYLTNGAMLDKGESADIDRFRLDGILDYRTLVLRRGPAASRPPSIYRLVWSGRFYEVWQRPDPAPNTIIEHLALGDASQAAGVPRCADVLRLARLPGVVSLATATRPEAIPLGYPRVPGTRTALVDIPGDGEYTAWLGGDWYGLASMSVDGRTIGSMREELDWPGNFTDMGTIRLSPGRQLVKMSYSTGGLHPGSGVTPYAFGPAYLTRETARDPFVTLPPSQARTLCGKRLDWIEALRAA